MRWVVLFAGIGLALGFSSATHIASSDALPADPTVEPSKCGPVAVQFVRMYGMPCVLIRLIGEGSKWTTCRRPV